MQRARRFLTLTFFFFTGAMVCSLVIISTAYLTFTFSFRDRVYPGVKVSGVDFTGQTISEVEKFFDSESKNLGEVKILISHPQIATISASGRDINLTYDSKLLASRVFSIGRQTKNFYYNLLQVFSANRGAINLPLEVKFDFGYIEKKIDAISASLEKKPVDAVFKFSKGVGPDKKGRVETYQASKDGLLIDRDMTNKKIKEALQTKLQIHSVIFTLPTKVVSPNITSSTADKMGIKSLLGKGESYFYDSIPGRVFNIGLGTEKVAGSLIPPGETFSFSQAIGTVSAVFGFAKAYSIKEGKTVLDDGGGVCQVSTTLYRAVLNSGLPVVERSPHSYRVGFYEQGGFLPGMDATVYPPNPDFKFKNDTAAWILLQATFDRELAKLTFEIFGTSDGRKTTLLGPYFISTSPPPSPIYEDDPSMPAGQVKQVDTAHAGAKVYFIRKVVRGNKVLIDERVTSDYIPWPARFLKGTKTI